MFVYMENKSGLRTEPWGVPVLVGDGLRDSMNCVVVVSTEQRRSPFTVFN